MKAIIHFSVLFLICACSHDQPKVVSEAYKWKSVQIVGGGFVDGIEFHPKEPSLRYCRTDMGGAYRWDEVEKKWLPLLDWISYEDRNLMGVESIALDPENPDALYLSCGTYTNAKAPNGAVLRSNDRGKTFERVDMPFKMGGNENGRGNGERMMVDPQNGNIIYLGTRNDGLWKSEDAGKTWFQVTSFPEYTESMPDSLNERQKGMWQWALKGSGIINVLFDPTSSNGEGCQTIYVAVSLMNRENFYRSLDAGKTWEPVPGQPTNLRPTHSILASDGNLYISYGDIPGPFFMYYGAVWRFNTHSGQWTDITPEKPNKNAQDLFGYATVTVDPSNPNILLATAFHRSGRFGGDDIFRSLDKGATWTAVFANGVEWDYTIAPYVEFTPIHWMFDIEIDPFNANHAIFTTGFGGFETFNLSDVDKGEKTIWSVYTKGIEETVPLELCSPPEGANLITGVGDYAGFVHWNIDKAEEGAYFTNPHFGNTDGVTCAYLNPKVLVRVGIASGHHPGSNIGYSLDFGKTWQPASMPFADAKHGHIAVSADASTWVWTPVNSVPYYTNDMGQTWNAIVTVPENTRIVADKMNASKFYGIDLINGLLYNSTDSAKSFVATELNLAKGKVEKNSFRGDERGGQDRIYATPGFENDLWIPAFDGLYHSVKDAGAFISMNGITEIHGFGFGKEAPGEDYPALYLIGVVNGVRGIFRSTDKANSWIRINDDQHQWGLLLHITGDPKKYGRVYVGTHGRGAIYGDPI